MTFILDAAHFKLDDLPKIPNVKTKNILVLNNGRSEYRDIPIHDIFSVLVKKFNIKCEKRALGRRCHNLDLRIMNIYRMLERLVKEDYTLFAKLPLKPERISRMS